VVERAVEDQWSVMVGGRNKDSSEPSTEKRRLHFKTGLRDRQVGLIENYLLRFTNFTDVQLLYSIACKNLVQIFYYGLNTSVWISKKYQWAWRAIGWLVESLTSHLTHYKSYRRRSSRSITWQVLAKLNKTRGSSADERSHVVIFNRQTFRRLAIWSYKTIFSAYIETIWNVLDPNGGEMPVWVPLIRHCTGLHWCISRLRLSIAICKRCRCIQQTCHVISAKCYTSVAITTTSSANAKRTARPLQKY